MQSSTEHTVRRCLNSFALLMLLAIAPLSHAGEYTDQLSRCLVQSSTGDDKLKLVKWMFTAMSLHPAVADLAPVTGATREAANKDMAELLVELLQNRCLDQAKTAIENEGAFALQTSFSVLGQVAATDLFSNPNVAEGLGSLTQYLDSEALDRSLGIGQ